VLCAISLSACSTGSSGTAGPGPDEDATVPEEDSGASNEDGAAPDAIAAEPDALAAQDASAPPTPDASSGGQDAALADGAPADAAPTDSAPADAATDGGACGAPSGSYSTSCTNCAVSAGVLTCTCKTGSGSTTASSSLDLCACPDTTLISNASGVLTCCGSPGGSYAQTCNECAITDTVLACTCKTNNGGVISSSLALCGCQPPHQISNTDGILTCQ
jgi:hypothetical protein